MLIRRHSNPHKKHVSNNNEKASIQDEKKTRPLGIWGMDLKCKTQRIDLVDKEERLLGMARRKANWHKMNKRANEDAAEAARSHPFHPLSLSPSPFMFFRVPVYHQSIDHHFYPLPSSGEKWFIAARTINNSTPSQTHNGSRGRTLTLYLTINQEKELAEMKEGKGEG